jgi:hypothetical protein
MSKGNAKGEKRRWDFLVFLRRIKGMRIMKKMGIS